MAKEYGGPRSGQLFLKRRARWKEIFIHGLSAHTWHYARSLDVKRGMPCSSKLQGIQTLPKS